MKIKRKKIGLNVKQSLPIYFNDMSIIVTEKKEIASFLKELSKTYRNIDELSEPKYFPSIYHKPISKF